MSPSLSLDSRRSSPPSPCNEAKLEVQASLRLGLARLGEGGGLNTDQALSAARSALSGSFSSLPFRSASAQRIFVPLGLLFVRSHSLSRDFLPPTRSSLFLFSFLYIRIFEYYCFELFVISAIHTFPSLSALKRAIATEGEHTYSSDSSPYLFYLSSGGRRSGTA